MSADQTFDDPLAALADLPAPVLEGMVKLVRAVEPMGSRPREELVRVLVGQAEEAISYGEAMVNPASLYAAVAEVVATLEDDLSNRPDWSRLGGG